MATQILPIAVGAADSGDVVVTGTLAVSLKGAAFGASVEIYLKSDGGTYHKIDALTYGDSSRMISAPGSYRFSREAASAVCGVFSG